MSLLQQSNSSDLLRAVQSAQCIAAQKGLELHQDPALRERHLGTVIQGLTYAEAEAQHPEACRQLRTRRRDEPLQASCMCRS